MESGRRGGKEIQQFIRKPYLANIIFSIQLFQIANEAKASGNFICYTSRQFFTAAV